MPRVQQKSRDRAQQSRSAPRLLHARGDGIRRGKGDRSSAQSFQLGRGMIGKIAPADLTQNISTPSTAMVRRARRCRTSRSRDERFQPPAHMQIGFEFAIVAVDNEAQGGSGPASTTSPTLVRKVSNILAVLLGHAHLHGDERRVGDPDADLFHRRDEIGLAVLVLSEARSENSLTSGWPPIGVPI